MNNTHTELAYNSTALTIRSAGPVITGSNSLPVTSTTYPTLSNDGFNTYAPLEIPFSGTHTITSTLTSITKDITYPSNASKFPPYSICEVEGLIAENLSTVAPQFFRLTFNLYYTSATSNSVIFARSNGIFNLGSISSTTYISFQNSISAGSTIQYLPPQNKYTLTLRFSGLSSNKVIRYNTLITML
jgi:hypothetical protein